ncbi:hypothetical protein BZZ01_07045 [Nostocales cyanobacterium HT-58-2]|nr:hypothetical protein BZZ01_07045 [Nostocales cyanobacterium HT-58-2]
MKMKQAKPKRKRGVVLTPVGLKRLQQAILSLEIAENKGIRLTLEQLGNRMNVSARTLSRLWSLSTGVDQKTLKLCFSALNLELHSEDHTVVSEADEAEAFDSFSESSYTQENLSQFSFANLFIKEHSEQGEQPENPSYPDGPVPLDSPFYVERPPIEELVHRELTQPGCVIRIQAPRQMGKSSLVLRLLAFAQKQGYRTVNLNCYQIDSECLTDLNKLLRCLCWQIATELGIDPNLKGKWDEEIGCKLSSSFYFQNYLLKQCQSPVVLVFNEADRFFEHPHICQEFFALLRSWSEEARHNLNWQKLKLVVVCSTEKYLSLDINCSPFNIGLPIRLNEFTQLQVEDLARRYGLDWRTSEESAQLMSLVGGHPALIQMSLYYLCCQGITMQKLIQDAMTNGGIYRYHLWRHWRELQEDPSLARTYAEMVTAKQSVYLNPIDTYKLESLGLIRFEGDDILPRCELYRAYFAKQLAATI